jgi:hypothetical protein
MDTGRFVQIICSACGGKIVAVVGQPRPATCGLCKEPLEPVAPPPSRAELAGEARQAETGTRAPAAFPRGTFTNTGRMKPPPAAARSSSGKTPKQPPSPIADLKRKLLGLFTPRS